MKHSFKKILALVLTAATVFALSAVAASPVLGADTAPAGTGKTPIAAFDFKKDLKDHSGRTDVKEVVLDSDEGRANDADKLKPTVNSTCATWEEGKGIKLDNGYVKLPSNIFSNRRVGYRRLHRFVHAHKGQEPVDIPVRNAVLFRGEGLLRGQK